MCLYIAPGYLRPTDPACSFISNDWYELTEEIFLGLHQPHVLRILLVAKRTDYHPAVEQSNPVQYKTHFEVLVLEYFYFMLQGKFCTFDSTTFI